MIYVAYVVLFLSFMNLLRMGLFLIGSDINDTRRQALIRRQKVKDDSRRTRSPLVSVLVPAHNEELTLRRNLDSIFANTYKNIELIIINDSSTDRTYNIARYFQRRYKNRFKKIKLLSVNVRGKARAMNAGLKYARGSLFMCLDADSVLDCKAIQAGVKQFSDPSIACVAANVKIIPDKGLLNLFQQIEYLIGHQAKKTETLAGVQYIVGGVGSMYRTKLVKNLGMYDTDTITEDIDLSVKMISYYSGKYRVGYDPDIMTFTEAVTDIKGLMRQRFRWKYGRYQVFLKYRHLFWSRKKKYSKVLSWFYLPYALFNELICMLEPLSFLFMIYLLVNYGDLAVIASSFLVFTFYVSMYITGVTSGYSLAERIRFIVSTPFVYVGVFVLSFVEYTATIRGFKNLLKIYKEHKSGNSSCEWQHVERKGTIISG